MVHKVWLFYIVFVTSIVLLNCGSSEPPKNDLAPPLDFRVYADKTISFWGLNNEEYFVGYNLYEIKEITVSNSMATYIDGTQEQLDKIIEMITNMYPSDDTSLDETDLDEIKMLYTAYRMLNELRLNESKELLIEPEDPNGNIPLDSRLKPASTGISLPTFTESQTMNVAFQIFRDASSMISSDNYVALTAYSYIDNIDSSLSEVRKVITE